MTRRLFSACAALAAAALACTAYGGVSTFSNAAAVTIPGAGTSGNASAYPSAIVVAGLTDPVGLVRVRLIGLSHTNPDDIDILLVGPTGVQVRLMSDCGGSDDVSGIDLVFDDSFPALPNSSLIAAGTYNPSNFGAGNDGFAGTLNGNLGAFRGTDGNGTWNLYIVDDSTNEVGSLSGGWELEILDSICVTTTANAGPGSLRQAINDANANAGHDVICFAIPTTDPNYSGGVWRINPSSALPNISDQLTIDGLTQPGASHATWPPTLNIILDGTGLNSSGLVLLDSADSSLIRGLVIQNFSEAGVALAGADLCKVQCNFIGTDHTGTSAAANGSYGVAVFPPPFGTPANDNTIGVDGDGVDDDRERNLISGNALGGVGILNSSNNIVAGNYIGVAADGIAALSTPTADGVLVGSILGTADGTRIGTNADGMSDELERNVIGGNGIAGVRLYSNGLLASTRGSRIMGNFIGAGADGTTPVGNGVGVVCDGPLADNNRIGFDQMGADNPAKSNLIAFNTGAGVVIRGDELNNAAQGNWVRGNSIHSNGALGIDLGDDGLTLNDDGDGDNGANEFKNFPVIDPIVGSTISGTYNSIANKTYDIDVYQNASADPSNHGEGEVYLGSTTVTTDGTGNGTWNLNVVFRGTVIFVSATATDRDDERGTSEFSLVAEAAVGLDCQLACADITVPSESSICEADVDFGEIVSQECLDAGYVLECTIDDGMGGMTPVSSGSPFPVGTTTVTCILRDPLGNEVDECTFDVTVTNVDMPTLLCPDNIVTTTDAGICGASVSFMTSVIEPCDSGPGLYGLVCTANGVEVLSGDVFPVGVTTVECCIYPTSLGGNGPITPIDCCTFTVTVTDDEPPVTMCQPDAQVLVGGCDPIVLTGDDVLMGGLAGITDNCCTDGFIVSIVPDTFTCPPLGTSPIINVTVMDCNGNSYTCTLQVEFVGPDCNENGLSDYCDVCSGLSLDCNNNWVPDECECYWCNGEFPVDKLFATEDGQLSHIGGGAPDGAKVADDFYLEPGCAHRISAFRGKLLNNSIPQLRKARLEFFEDCNGKPAAEPFASFLSTEFAEIIDVVPADDGFYALTYRFDLCEECLWLEGGKTYWVSLIGLSDNINDDLSFWLAHEDYIPLLGSVPCKADGTRISWTEWTFGDWMSIEECCLGCVNMDFCLDGYRCPIIWENGKPDLGAGRGGSASGAHQAGETRTADSFVIKPGCVEELTVGGGGEVPLLCRGGEAICLIEAWIWTNCDPVHGFIELYRDLPCGPPELENTPFVVYSGDEIEATRFEETWVANGQTHHLWRLRVKHPELTLCAGTNYWISAGAYSTGSFVVNSYFANAAPKCDPCATPHTWRITPGQYRSIRALSTEWADVEPRRDFAFRIAKRDPREILTDTIGNPDDGEGNPNLPDGTPACIADANLDGSVTVDDIFAFLAAWFSGCP